ncbi:MFS transporter [Polaromonas sp. YR568]|uniref:MFS transporter n=1 Tax=Polaromonas sp. YR568 TaxID=1855301 RepID=UPI0020C874B9|nr:MFS transporter [Polaromonas sp. YR568]
MKSSSSSATRWKLPSAAAFPLLAVLLFAFFVAGSAPSPLFVVFQQQWGFSPALLTVAFAIYAIALLASLLVAGSLSDHIGRRPVVFTALLLQAGAMLTFLLAESINGIIAARIVQGIATGMVSGALTAAVVEAAPAAQKRLGAMIGSVSPLAGLAVGALLTGIAVKFALHPVPLVFGVLAAICVVGAVATLFLPESVTPRPGALASLVPRISIPVQARAEFARGLPTILAVWSLAGLYLSLVPSMLQQIFGIHDGVVNGLAIAAFFGLGAASPTLLKNLSPVRMSAVGMSVLAVGTGLVVVSLATRSVALFFVGTALAGFGGGSAFSSQVQTLAPLAQPHQRAELFAALYAASYLIFSVPAMLAGRLIAPLGLQATAEGYAALVLVVAALGAWLRWGSVRAAALR